ncbi:hypothetical protein PTKIN_Ptkin11bG0171600 [Pterospermum kingtungense]
MAHAVGEKKKAIDRISSLPDDILLHIVSFLPLDDTLRIRFLSTRFGKLSRSIPNILICRDNRCKTPYQFTKFMEESLSNHDHLPRLKKFRISCCNFTYRNATISNWIDSAVIASVSNLQELDIRACHRVKLPPSVFSCEKLRFLRLDYIKVNEIPTGLFFPCLKTLKLESIIIVSEYTLKNLLSIVCPVIEISIIKNCTLKISSKNEKLLFFGYLRGTWVQGDCPNNLSKRVLKELELQDGDVSPLSVYFSDMLILFPVGSTASYGNPPFFQNLTHLKVNVDVLEVGRTNCFSALLLLLQHSPKLTSLELERASLQHPHCDALYRYRQIKQWDTPATTVFQCLLCNLETVHIIDYYHFQAVEVVKYFLKNAKVLKKLVLSVGSPLRDEIKASILDEPRASAQCEIEIIELQSNSED